ncbi:hypothetical protein PCE1_002165 [Barthelona sp. PCE]
MVQYMTEISKLGVELSVDERNLLSVAWKNKITARRASCRYISMSEQRELKKGNSHRVEMLSEYKRKIEGELADICKELLDVIDMNLIPAASSQESKVFFLKMKGDYYRYLAEFCDKEAESTFAQESLKAYESATEIADGELAPTNPIRLGLALNFSVFYYEILKLPDRARDLAKRAFDEAITDYESLPDASVKDSTLIMELLRDNLTLWMNDAEYNDPEE